MAARGTPPNPVGENIVDNSDLFACIRLFASVDPESVRLYLEDCEYQDAKAGEVLIRPDRENQNIYIVLYGRLEVRVGSLENPPLTYLEQGSCAGEMSILERKQPSAFVVAEIDTHMLVINREHVWELINASHAIARNLLVILSERVRSDNEVIADSVVIMRQYERKSITDALTGLYNRYWMAEQYERVLKRCKMDDKPVCLLMLDIDRFKSYNNQYGHLVGDHTLCYVADMLQKQFRPTDMIARFGGDEFTVLMPDTGLDDAINIAGKVRERIVSGPRIGQAQDASPVTVSVGVVEMTGSDTLQTMLNNADSAMYRAKEKGRNCTST